MMCFRLGIYSPSYPIFPSLAGAEEDDRRKKRGRQWKGGAAQWDGGRWCTWLVER